MPFLLLGLALLVFLMLGGNVFAKADPRVLARLLRSLGGVALLAVSALLAFRAAWPSPGRRSAARSAWLDMTLDHDSGAVEGRVLQGRFAGAALSDLGPEALAALHAELRGDPDSLRLFEAYLDRRQPGWREDLKRDSAAGPRGPARSRALTEEEAYEVLGLRPGAGEAEIRQAHRALMKRVHPDQGGSTYLAARINEAKDILLRK